MNSNKKDNSERNKYVYSPETFVIQIKYKRHYSFLRTSVFNLPERSSRVWGRL